MPWLINIKYALLVGHLLFAVILAEEGGDLGVVVELPHGRLRGQDQGHYFSYESIPYAEPPLGDLRFESPREYKANWTTEFDATRKPVSCMQWDQFTPGDDKLVGVEDCLMVHVYRPKLSSASMRLPVLVFIHGGAFMFGSTKTDAHTIFMERGSFIVVKFTYRLGPLGFLSTEDDVITGNYGLKDQRMALKWIKQNIAHFGGDPDAIMVVGFSAGGASVHYQLLQPDFGHYAKVAVSFSGTALCPWAILKKSRLRAFELGRNLNCSGALATSSDLKECLRGRKAEEIVRGVRDFIIFGFNPFTIFGPVVESSTSVDAFLSSTPKEIIQAGNSSRVPWLVAYSAQDGGYNAAELLQKMPRRNEMIEEFNDRWYELAPYTLFYKDTLSSIEEIDDYSTSLKKRYLGEKEFSVATYYDVQRMYTDVLFKNGIEEAVRLHRSVPASTPVFAYVYDNPPDDNLGNLLSNRYDFKFGTVHGDDLHLIFPNIARRNPLRPDERIISEKLLAMLEGFIKNGSSLAYDGCEFEDNVGKSHLALTRITQNGCEKRRFDHFP